MNDISTGQLIDHFFEKGGRISDIYLKTPDLARPHSAAVVWIDEKIYVGDTTRKAVINALNHHKDS